jgi:hypothetical protein
VDTTALRDQIARALTTSRDPNDDAAVDESHLHANHDYSYACHLCTNNVDGLTDALLSVVAPLLATAAEREERLRADLEESERRHADRDEINATWVAYKNRVVARENAYRDQLATALDAWDERGTRPWLEALVPQACEEITRLRAGVSRTAPATPDDASYQITSAIVRRLQQAGWPLTSEQQQAVVQIVMDRVRSWPSAPVSGPEPATEFEGPEPYFERECDEYVDEEGHDRPEVEHCSHIRQVPAEPAPATSDGHRVTSSSVLSGGLDRRRGAQRVEVEPEGHPSPVLDDLEGDAVGVVVDHETSVARPPGSDTGCPESVPNLST